MLTIGSASRAFAQNLLAMFRQTFAAYPIRRLSPSRGPWLFLRTSGLRHRSRDDHHVHADGCPCRAKASGEKGLTARQALAKAMKDRFKDNYGHDLPEIDEEADATIETLLNAGIVIVEGKPQ